MVKKSKKRKLNKKKNETESQENAAEIEETSVKEDVETEELHEESSEEISKREHSEDDSDAEDKPKKKKKKNIPIPEQTGEKKGKKSIRQMKREKHAERQAEAQAASKDQLKSQCLAYLSQWKHAKQNWKFMKAKQVWLFKNKFSPDLVPDYSWPTFLEYFESAQGNIRKLLLDDANKVIKQKDEWLEAQKGKDEKEAGEEETANKEGPQKPDDTSYRRARDLIQCLEE